MSIKQVYRSVSEMDEQRTGPNRKKSTTTSCCSILGVEVTISMKSFNNFWRSYIPAIKRKTASSQTQILGLGTLCHLERKRAASDRTNQKKLLFNTGFCAWKLEVEILEGLQCVCMHVCRMKTRTKRLHFGQSGIKDIQVTQNVARHHDE